MDVPDFVHTCMSSLGDVGNQYGLHRMVASPAGRLESRPDGAQVMQIRISMTYDRATGPETRQATIVCVVLPNGRVQVVTPDEYP